MKSRTYKNPKDFQSRNAKSERKSCFTPKANGNISSALVSSWHGDGPLHNPCCHCSKPWASPLFSDGIQGRKCGWRKQDCFLPFSSLNIPCA